MAVVTLVSYFVGGGLSNQTKIHMHICIFHITIGSIVRIFKPRFKTKVKKKNGGNVMQNEMREDKKKMWHKGRGSVLDVGLHDHGSLGFYVNK